MRAIVSRMPGLLRPTRPLRTLLLLIVVSLMLSSCASGLRRVTDEAKVEEWGLCSHPQPGANILCLEFRRPL